MTPRTASTEFRWYEGLALLLCCIAIQLASEVMAQWGAFFYSPAADTGRTIYVSIGLAGLIFFVGILFDAFSDPIIGIWSDKTRSEPGRWRILPIHGRRRPFMFWGSIGMTVTSVLFWHPPVPGESFGNFLYATVIFCIHSGIFLTMCVVPFNALAPEIARSKEARVRVGAWIAAGMIIGLAVAELAPGPLMKALDPARGAKAGEELSAPDLSAEAVSPVESPVEGAEEGERDVSPVGMQRTALLFALVSFVFFQLAVWVVRERYRSDEHAVPTSSVQVAVQCLSNPTFLKYIAIFFLFNIGFLGVQRVLPYWAVTGLEGDESSVSILMAPFIVTALLSLVLTTVLSRYLPVKWLLFISLSIIAIGLPFIYIIAVLPVAANTKLLLGASLFAFCGVGQGMLYILFTPLLGEIIDLDEKTSGERREAAYGALHGLAWKASQALAVVVATQSMNLFGNSAERPLGINLMGPIAGVFAALGLVVCWSYPVLHVTKEDAESRQ